MKTREDADMRLRDILNENTNIIAALLENNKDTLFQLSSKSTECMSSAMKELTQQIVQLSGTSSIDSKELTTAFEQMTGTLHSLFYEVLHKKHDDTAAKFVHDQPNDGFKLLKQEQQQQQQHQQTDQSRTYYSDMTATREREPTALETNSSRKIEQASFPDTHKQEVSRTPYALHDDEQAANGFRPSFARNNFLRKSSHESIIADHSDYAHSDTINTEVSFESSQTSISRNSDIDNDDGDVVLRDDTSFHSAGHWNTASTVESNISALSKTASTEHTPGEHLVDYSDDFEETGENICSNLPDDSELHTEDSYHSKEVNNARQNERQQFSSLRLQKNPPSVSSHSSNCESQHVAGTPGVLYPGTKSVCSAQYFNSEIIEEPTLNRPECKTETVQSSCIPCDAHVIPKSESSPMTAKIESDFEKFRQLPADIPLSSFETKQLQFSQANFEHNQVLARRTLVESMFQRLALIREQDRLLEGQYEALMTAGGFRSKIPPSLEGNRTDQYTQTSEICTEDKDTLENELSAKENTMLEMDEHANVYNKPPSVSEVESILEETSLQLRSNLSTHCNDQIEQEQSIGEEEIDSPDQNGLDGERETCKDSGKFASIDKTYLSSRNEMHEFRDGDVSVDSIHTDTSLMNAESSSPVTEEIFHDKRKDIDSVAQGELRMQSCEPCNSGNDVTSVQNDFISYTNEFEEGTTSIHEEAVAPGIKIEQEALLQEQSVTSTRHSFVYQHSYQRNDRTDSLDSQPSDFVHAEIFLRDPSLHPAFREARIREDRLRRQRRTVSELIEKQQAIMSRLEALKAEEQRLALSARRALAVSRAHPNLNTNTFTFPSTYKYTNNNISQHTSPQTAMQHYVVEGHDPKASKQLRQAQASKTHLNFSEETKNISGGLTTSSLNENVAKIISKETDLDASLSLDFEDELESDTIIKTTEEVSDNRQDSGDGPVHTDTNYESNTASIHSNVSHSNTQEYTFEFENDEVLNDFDNSVTFDKKDQLSFGSKETNESREQKEEEQRRLYDGYKVDQSHIEGVQPTQLHPTFHPSLDQEASMVDLSESDSQERELRMSLHQLEEQYEELRRKAITKKRQHRKKELMQRISGLNIKLQQLQEIASSELTPSTSRIIREKHLFPENCSNEQDGIRPKNGHDAITSAKVDFDISDDIEYSDDFEDNNDITEPISDITEVNSGDHKYTSTPQISRLPEAAIDVEQVATGEISADLSFPSDINATLMHLQQESIKSNDESPKSTVLDEMNASSGYIENTKEVSVKLEYSTEFEDEGEQEAGVMVSSHSGDIVCEHERHDQHDEPALSIKPTSTDGFMHKGEFDEPAKSETLDSSDIASNIPEDEDLQKVSLEISQKDVDIQSQSHSVQKRQHAVFAQDSPTPLLFHHSPSTHVTPAFRNAMFESIFSDVAGEAITTMVTLLKGLTPEESVRTVEQTNDEQLSSIYSSITVNDDQTGLLSFVQHAKKSCKADESDNSQSPLPLNEVGQPSQSRSVLNSPPRSPSHLNVNVSMPTSPQTPPHDEPLPVSSPDLIASQSPLSVLPRLIALTNLVMTINV